MRLPWARYLDEIRLQGDMLLAAAEDMGAPVPSCPGWDVRHVVAHTGMVHRHKERIVRERLQTQPEKMAPPEGDDAVVGWYAEGLDMLVDTLAATDPTVRVYTWYAPDQSAGFWYRRMAHETAVHRADVELARNSPTPLAQDLAADGVDEVLGPTICGDEPDGFHADGRKVMLAMPDAGAQLHLLLGEGENGPGWVLADGAADDAVTRIRAPASDFDLWTWGRLPADVLEVEGDTSLVDWIRRIVSEGT